MSPRTRRALLSLLWGLGLLLSIWHYWEAGIRPMWPANDRLRSYDQVFYVRRAAEIAVHGETQRVQRSRMPVYPHLLSWLHEPGKSEQELFPRYKWFNAVFSVAVLLGVLAVARWALGTALAVPLTLGAAFSFIVFKAVLVQPEVLFYFLYFLTFVVMVRALRTADWRWGAAAGALTAAAHLTKASVLPMLLAFLGSAALQWMGSLRGGGGQAARCCPRVPAVLLAALGIYLGLMAPFMWNTYRTFGSPIYDPNNRIYFWASSADEMDALQQIDLAQQRPALDAAALATPQIQKYLPIWAGEELAAELRRRVESGERVLLEGRYDILPGSRRFLREHGLAGALDRMGRGTLAILERNLHHRNGYGRHLLVWTGTALVVALCALLLARSRWLERWKPARHAILFVGLNLAGNLLLYGFFSYVSNRNRFFLTLFMPTLCACGWVIASAARSLPWVLPVPLPRWAGGGVWQLTPFHVVVILLWAFAIDDVWDIDAGPRQLPQ